MDNVDKSVYKSKMPKNHNKDGVDNFGGNESGKLWKLWTDTCPNVWFVHIVKRAGMYRNGGENRMLRSTGEADCREM